MSIIKTLEEKKKEIDAKIYCDILFYNEQEV